MSPPPRSRSASVASAESASMVVDANEGVERKGKRKGRGRGRNKLGSGTETSEDDRLGKRVANDALLMRPPADPESDASVSAADAAAAAAAARKALDAQFAKAAAAVIAANAAAAPARPAAAAPPAVPSAVTEPVKAVPTGTVPTGTVPGGTVPTGTVPSGGKLGKSSAAAISAPASSAAVAPAGPPPQKMAWDVVRGGTSAILAELSSVQSSVKVAVARGVVDPNAACAIHAAIQRYDDLITALAVQNATLAAQSHSAPAATTAAPVVASAASGSAAATPATPVALPRARRPVETWSAVVSCSDPSMTPKQVVEKVRNEVAPALKVRVHEVRELKRGGAIIRTPSSSEMRKVVASKKFAEVGLEVQPNRSLRPKVTVFDVDTAIKAEEFMQELFANNFEEHMTEATFKKSVHLETKQWTQTAGETVNVNLEVDEKALAILDGTGRVNGVCVWALCHRAKKKPVEVPAEGSGAATSEDDAGQIPSVAISAELRRAALLANLQARKASSEAAAAEGELSPSVAVAADSLREGELGLAFSMLKSRKSPGMDGFTGEMCNSVWNSIPEYMKELLKVARQDQE
ncbi:hypothetical protein ACLKA6_003250 [Drosophila palustris]